MGKYYTNRLPDRILYLEDGKEYLWFSGTDYLGMGYNEEFRSYLEEGISLYGSHFGSSRNNSLQLNIYQEAETALALYTHSPSSLTVSSGMWAGQLVMKEIENIVLQNKSTFLFSDIQYHYSPKVHPALWGKDYVADLSDWTKWAQKTIQFIQESPENISHIICSDSVGSPWVEEFDFSVFNDLPAGKNIWLVVDDSHGLGATGNNGNGIYQKITAIRNVKKIVVASLNKAMGIPAGMILADDSVIGLLRSSPWFAGASPCAPAYMYALNKFLVSGAYSKAFHQLQSNIRYFKNGISNIDLFSGIVDYPVFCSINTSLFPFLLKNAIMASCFSYPLSTDLPITRLAISAIHQKEDLDQLAKVCIKFKSLILNSSLL